MPLDAGVRPFPTLPTLLALRAFPTLHAPLASLPPGTHDGPVFRKDLLDRLTAEFRSVSSLARELGLRKGDVEDDLRHILRSARAAGYEVEIVPARCRSCGFTFGEEKLSKPGKCPECRGTRIFEAQVRVAGPGSPSI